MVIMIILWLIIIPKDLGSIGTHNFHFEGL